MGQYAGRSQSLRKHVVVVSFVLVVAGSPLYNEAMRQCGRDTRCVKDKGHKGWCKTTGEKEWGDAALKERYN